MRLSLEVSVIAGVGPGLGAPPGRKLAKEGCRLALLARSSDFVERLSDELRQYGNRGADHSHRCQQCQPGGTAFERIRDRLGPVDLLINNASGSGPFSQTFLDISPESFARGWQIGYSAGSSARNKWSLQCSLKMPAASCSPARLLRSVEARSLSAAQNLRCADWLRLWQRELRPEGIDIAHIVVDGVIQK